MTEDPDDKFKFPIRYVRLPDSLIEAGIREDQARVITEITVALREDTAANIGALRKDLAGVVDDLQTKADRRVHDLTIRIAAMLLITIVVLVTFQFFR